jgi:hypothetical protein
MHAFRLPVLRLAAAVCFTASLSPSIAGQIQQMPAILIPLRMPGDPPIALPETAANSGLPLQWEVATGPAVVSGALVTLTGALGPVTLRASQPGNAEWDPLTAHVSFAVTEEGGFTQISMGGAANRANRLALGRNGRILGWNFVTFSEYVAGPIRSPAGIRWKSITAGGGYQALGVKEDGSLWIWTDTFSGWNNYAGTDAALPTRLGTENNWKMVAAGRDTRLAIKQDGTIWGWEDNATLPPKLPVLLDSRTDWVELLTSYRDNAIVRRATGQCYSPYNITGSNPVSSEGLWKTGSISSSGAVRVRDDGTLWFGLSLLEQLSGDTDWKATACLLQDYLALRQDGTLWRGDMSGSTTKIVPPTRIPFHQKCTTISAGSEYSGAITEDGAFWTTYRTTPHFGRFPAYSPQRLDFMAAKEQPFPVVAGTVLTLPSSTMSSHLPVQLSVVSGPAEIIGQGISFTGPGLVEVTFRQPGDNTWAAFEERRTFLSGTAGPEIAVHDGPSVAGPARRNAGTVISLGKHTRAVAAAGFVRTWVVENAGTHPLELSAVEPEAASPLTFTTSFTPVTLAPGDSLPLTLTFTSTVYGSHQLNVLIQSTDADEAAYRIPLSLELANTPPTAGTGPDRHVHAGRPLRLDGAYFSRDYEQPASALTYHWDLDGQGYLTAGALQEITLTNPGDHLTAKLRVTDGDGATSFSECVITAQDPGTPIPTALRLQPDGWGEFSFHVPVGRRYRVFESYNLTTWRREDENSGRKLSPSEPGPDGFFHARIWVGPAGLDRQFFRAQEVSE